MPTQQNQLLSLAQLRNSTAAVTAVASGTELTDARLIDFESGTCVVTVHAIATPTDQSYTITLEGRDSSSGAWRPLGSITLSAANSLAAVGVYAFAVDRFAKRMRISVTAISGTSPSITYSAIAIAQQQGYLPAPASAITT